MEWQTKVEVEKPDFGIDYSTPILLLGSCFAENIGEKLLYYRFPADVNPFGIIYNPVSVANALELLLENRPFTYADLKCGAGKWSSWFHHGKFSDTDPERCLQNINERLKISATFLQKADLIMITFGTAWVYENREEGKIVSNCHKFPASDFRRFRLSIESIAGRYEEIITRLRKLNPKIKFLFTVSPIRHFKDGAHGNQLSKSVLLLAIEEIRRKFDGIYYFPSYEIVMDELRDYRYYADDMLHISSGGIAYIWEKFQEKYFSPSVREVMKEIDKINKGFHHRPFEPESDTYRQFLKSLELRLAVLKEKYPGIQ